MGAVKSLPIVYQMTSQSGVLREKVVDKPKFLFSAELLCTITSEKQYYIYIYIYLGLGSYRLTIKERNGGVGIRGKNRVVDECTSCVSNMNCKGFYDGETKLL